ncbi:NAD(P)/FAD-dependent oxidoreductase [Carboxydothermus hydrogenoformans]|uniref:Pyridine nucleotide-disulphide oxidoreductase family protein n=1 Tax=Carboxydothermus hydrogenoformans (strain ATCC BAA-161 / DSM 6008 / Z-2901) TaxID=246194 RepID=Q3AAT1_CARHZ|nr:NAD(P)/FAD-dependent oxidoreductase [Carboxydothermus hydrogenoformans]ABB15485.1 conserved hypothetical protein [Carboxydothermus hydrogenoformans Z-2901]
MKRTIVIGGGAAGMMAALSASGQVLLIEKTDSLGKKLCLTGNGRGNITNITPINNFYEYYHNGKFLKKALFTFTNEDLMAFFIKNGLKLKVEEKKVYPASDKAKDVVKLLEKLLRKKGVEILYKQKVKDILVNDGQVLGVRTKDGIYYAAKVIVATGGASFPQTGSSGDGFELLSKLGHNIISPRPALVPLKLAEKVAELSGITVMDVNLALFSSGKKLKARRGPLLFTHFGLSGPTVLNLSCYLPLNFSEAKIKIDFFPEYSVDELKEKIISNGNKTLKNALPGKLPEKLREWLLNYYGQNPKAVVHSLSPKVVTKVSQALKGTFFNLTGTMPLEMAYVTAGGVDVKEINPSTMESRLIKGVYLAGEVIDCHGETGGFNLQMAFSTGYLAGKS